MDRGGVLSKTSEKCLQAVILIRQATEKHLSSGKNKQLQGSFVVPQGGTPQDDSRKGFSRA